MKKIRRWIQRIMGKAMQMALKDPAVQAELWRSSNLPRAELLDSMNLAVDPWLAAWEKASRDSAEYLEKNLVTAKRFTNREQLFDLCMENVSIDGLYVEFGCGFKAKSVRYLAGKTDETIHGFDSFEGLPDDWFGEIGKGGLSTDGQLPDVPENVKLHKGWFENSLPVFLENHDRDAAFIHIDCDVYSSTKTVLQNLRPRIRSGTVIQFDEYFNYPGWREHEYKAFQEFVGETGCGYEYLGYGGKFSVAVRIL